MIITPRNSISLYSDQLIPSLVSSTGSMSRVTVQSCACPAPPMKQEGLGVLLHCHVVKYAKLSVHHFEWGVSLAATSKLFHPLRKEARETEVEMIELHVIKTFPHPFSNGRSPKRSVSLFFMNGHAIEGGNQRVCAIVCKGGQRRLRLFTWVVMVAIEWLSWHCKKIWET